MRPKYRDERASSPPLLRMKAGADRQSVRTWMRSNLNSGKALRYARHRSEFALDWERRQRTRRVLAANHPARAIQLVRGTAQAGAATRDCNRSNHSEVVSEVAVGAGILDICWRRRPLNRLIMRGEVVFNVLSVFDIEPIRRFPKLPLSCRAARAATVSLCRRHHAVARNAVRPSRPPAQTRSNGRKLRQVSSPSTMARAMRRPAIAQVLSPCRPNALASQTPAWSSPICGM